MDQTIDGGPESRDGTDTRVDWALTVVHHGDESFLGRGCRVGDSGVILGRESSALGADLFDDGRVSRRHAEVSRGDGGLILRDAGSRNGTYLNGSRIEEQALAAGDVIGLGTLMLLCHRVPAEHTAVEDPRLAGIGPHHAALVASIEAVAARDTPVVIVGETGTGRDRVARALHRRSARAGRFVAVHCGVLSAGNPRAELLGPGGLVEAAESGTLYLDGVGDASAETQMSLLRLLETDGAQASVRILASTSTPLAGLVEAGGLREDFAARFGRFEIRLAPLRERIEDIPFLARAFVERFAGAPAALDVKLALRLLRYPWPGNIRELESIVERAVIEAGDAARIPLSPAIDELLSAGRDASLAEGSGELSSRESNPAELRVAADGSWFEVRGQDRVELENRRALPRLLAALLDARTSAAGLSVPDLVDRGWPGERIIEEAGANRVYVALTTLRKLGLRDYIARNRDGYHLDTNTRIDVVS